jgi:hypothetical protein
MEDTRNLVVQMYVSETQRLLDADPIYVSEEMCEVIEAACDSFSPEPLMETDLITPRGFIYFERPFVIPDRFDEPTTIAGASWQRLFSSSTPKKAAAVERQIVEWGSDNLVDLENKLLLADPDIQAWGISLTLYADMYGYLPGEKEENTHANKIRELYPAPSLPPMIPLHLTPWYFKMTFDGNEWDENGRPTGAEWWWRIIQTTFRLMQQRISVKHRQLPERTARREAKRIGARPETEIVVVRLRREKGETKEPTGESANYSHRFIVGGHWRKQPYTSLGIWRQIWISPYVKGPEDKPLIVRPKRVYQWDR